MTHYSLDTEIEQFFSRTPVTREECDKRAIELTGKPVQPVQLQGAFSYTLEAGERIIQFRSPQSPLDTNKLALTRRIFGKLVPAHISHGVIGPLPPLSVYVMEKVPGITFLEASLKSPQCVSWQEKTVTDFAGFFAQSWLNRLAAPYQSELSLTDLEVKLDRLIEHLPQHFISAVHNIRNELPVLFAGYPLSLTHGDLCEMKIMVEPQTGGITGFIDWAEAQILPFGMSFWGLQNMLGTMDSKGWRYYDHAAPLESLFWEVFHNQVGDISDDDRHAIKIAEKAGLVLRYGYTWDDGVHERPVTVQDSSIRYLDAFLHRL